MFNEYGGLREEWMPNQGHEIFLNALSKPLNIPRLSCRTEILDHSEYMNFIKSSLELFANSVALNTLLDQHLFEKMSK